MEYQDLNKITEMKIVCHTYRMKEMAMNKYRNSTVI